MLKVVLIKVNIRKSKTYSSICGISLLQLLGTVSLRKKELKLEGGLTLLKPTSSTKRKIVLFNNKITSDNSSEKETLELYKGRQLKLFEI
jgi:hypothetical protein